MSKWLIGDLMTNVTVTGGHLVATTANGDTRFTVGGKVTNAYILNGELTIDEEGVHDRYLTIGDALTNISVSAEGKVNVNDHTYEKDHIALINGMRTNIWLDAYGRIIVAPSGTNSRAMTIGGMVSNVYGGSDGAIIIGDIPVTINNLLLETGDDLLLEAGGKIILG